MEDKIRKQDQAIMDRELSIKMAKEEKARFEEEIKQIRVTDLLALAPKTTRSSQPARTAGALAHSFQRLFLTINKFHGSWSSRRRRASSKT